MNATTPPTLTDLIAFNRELASMVRAQIPLDLGLQSLSNQTETGFGQLATRLRDRLQQGSSLPEAFAAEAPYLPPAYAAVVASGLRAGRLPEALESISRSLKSTREIRRATGIALIYPYICLLVAISLGTILLIYLPMGLRRVIDSFQVGSDPRINFLFSVSEIANRTSYWLPLLVLALPFIVRYGPRWLPTRGWLWLTRMRWLPGMHRTEISLARGQFLELLALQLEHEVPLPDAIDASGQILLAPKEQQQLRLLSDRLRRGESLDQALTATRDLPTILSWTLLAGSRQGNLAVAVRELASAENHRARVRAAWTQFFVPTILSLGLAAIIIVLYVFTLFIPLAGLWSILTREAR